MRSIVLLLFVVSCAGVRPVKDLPLEKLLSSIRVTGEGRGRLTVNGNQNVFSFESLLKDKKDWILAVNVPLHGEEVMVLEDIKALKPSTQKAQSFESRLGPHVKEIRSLIRFLLAPDLGLERKCNDGACTVLGEKFYLIVEEDKVRIVRNNHELIALHLTESFFSRTQFTHKDLHLELFWK